MQYAPIALFTYNRADHTKKALLSLLENRESVFSDLYIFSDGPKNEQSASGVEENRIYIREVQKKYDLSNYLSVNSEGFGERCGFKSIKIVERDRNWGLAKSLIGGITDVINMYGRVIVVEDDLQLSPYFLKYMNDCLELYKDDEQVGAISGYVPNIKKYSSGQTFFLKFFHCWGWGTWKRSWDMLITDCNILLRQLRFKTYKLNLDNTFNIYGMIYGTKIGLMSSWYCRFYASLYLQNKYFIFPQHTLVKNCGCDGTGRSTHCGDIFGPMNLVSLYTKPIQVTKQAIVEDKDIRQSFAYEFWYENTVFLKNGRVKLLYCRFKSFIRRLLYVDCL